MDRPYDTAGQVAALEAEVARLSMKQTQLAVQNLRLLNVLVSTIGLDALNRPTHSGKESNLDMLHKIFDDIYDLANAE